MFSTSDSRRPDYNEAQALNELLQTASEYLAEANTASEDDNYDYFDCAQFTITIGGVSTAYILGGPQYQALCLFISSIAEENSYAVDFEQGTVTE